MASFGLDGVINEIGLRVFGVGFGQLDEGERKRVAKQVLIERRMLLIWENFESVRSMPDPRHPQSRWMRTAAGRSENSLASCSGAGAAQCSSPAAALNPGSATSAGSRSAA